MMLQTFCAILVMVMASAETSALMQWSRQAELAIPATAKANLTQNAAHPTIATHS